MVGYTVYSESEKGSIYYRKMQINGSNEERRRKKRKRRRLAIVWKSTEKNIWWIKNECMRAWSNGVRQDNDHGILFTKVEFTLRALAWPGTTSIKPLPCKNFLSHYLSKILHLLNVLRRFTLHTVLQKAVILLINLRHCTVHGCTIYSSISVIILLK